MDKIYQQAVIDVCSNFGFAKAYLNKKAESAIDFVKTKAKSACGVFDISLDCTWLIMARSKPFIGKTENMIMNYLWLPVILSIGLSKPDVQRVRVL